jgi:transposase
MGAALPSATRRRIIQGYLEGKACAALAEEFHVAYHTARVLCRRFDAEGESGLLPHYDRCGDTGIRSDALLYRAACFLKRRHPSWGGPFIRLQLQQRYPERAIPAVRTMQTWFKERGLTPARSKRPKPEKQWAREVHQVWQVDAKEHQRTADQAQACWLTFTDEYSTAILAAPVFPPGADLPGAARIDSSGPH